MLLKSIRLQNIRSYLDQEIDFPLGSTLLSGDVGCGKSTILLAMDFGLFGLRKGELEGTDLLRHGKDRGSVTLIFEMDGKEVEIEVGKPFGQIAVDVPGGEHVLEFGFKETKWKMALDLISAAVFLGAIYLIIKK